jgi:hypothetical protein
MNIEITTINLRDRDSSAGDHLTISTTPTDAQLRRWFRSLVHFHKEMQAIDRVTTLCFGFDDDIGDQRRDWLSVASMPEILTVSAEVDEERITVR